MLGIVPAGTFTLTEWERGAARPRSGMVVIEADRLMLVHMDEEDQQATRVDEASARLEGDTLMLAVASGDHYRVLAFTRQ